MINMCRSQFLCFLSFSFRFQNCSCVCALFFSISYLIWVWGMSNEVTYSYKHEQYKKEWVKEL